jgi:hypothetical protein
MEAVDAALQQLWSLVVAKHCDSPATQLETFDTVEFSLRLRAGVTKMAHDRYVDFRFKKRKRFGMDKSVLFQSKRSRTSRRDPAE